MSLLDPHLFDMTDIYPDGVVPIGNDGVQPLYDLRLSLSREFRNLPAWNDLAYAMSRVYYDQFESSRLAMQYSRVPEVLGSPYKALHLRVLGLDYRGSAFSDDDFDRINNFYSLYSRTTKWRDKFANFMGFMLGVRVELVRLWTADYRSFHPSYPEGQTVFDNPPGNWFPTTHVGLAYNDPNGVGSVDFAGLSELFYVMAPENLVLKWLGELETHPLGNLYLQTTGFETETITQRIGLVDKFTIAPHMLGLETEIQTHVFEPTPLDASVHLRTGALEYQYQKVLAAVPGFNWLPGKALEPDWTFQRHSEAAYWNSDGMLVWVSDDQPRLEDWDPNTSTVQGWIFEPFRYNYIHRSVQPWMDPWITTGLTFHKIVGGNPDGTPTARYVLVGSSPGSIFQDFTRNPVAEFDHSVVQLVFSSNGPVSFQVGLLQAGVASVVTVAWTGAALQAPANSGVDNFCPGWKRLWTCVDTALYNITSVTLIPCVDSNTITDIFYCGLENGALPTRPIRTNECDLGYRAPESLQLNTTVSVLNQDSGFFFARARHIQPNGTWLELGADTSDRLTATSNLSFRLDCYEPRELNAPATALQKVAYSWNNSTTVSWMHQNSENAHDYRTPLQFALKGALGDQVDGSEFWGWLQRLTLLPSYQDETTFAGPLDAS